MIKIQNPKGDSYFRETGKGKITGLWMAVMKGMSKKPSFSQWQTKWGPGLKSSCREGGFNIQSLGLVDLHVFLSALWFCFMFLKVFMVALKKKATVFSYLIIKQMNDIICHIFIL